MSKISQRELLEEGFWDKFNSVKRQVGSVVNTYGSLLAPEIADPIKKGVEFMRGAKKSRKRAGLTEDELVKEELIENGYYPFDANTKIRWASDKLSGKKKKNTDDTYTGAIKVGQLGYDDAGQPFKEADYADPLKSLVTFKLHPKTREFKIIQHPNRTMKVKPTQGQASPPAPTPPAPTPPAPTPPAPTPPP